jgi:hypothetical protein
MRAAATKYCGRYLHEQQGYVQHVIGVWLAVQLCFRTWFCCQPDRMVGQSTCTLCPLVSGLFPFSMHSAALGRLPFCGDMAQCGRGTSFACIQCSRACAGLKGCAHCMGVATAARQQPRRLCNAAATTAGQSSCSVLHVPATECVGHLGQQRPTPPACKHLLIAKVCICSDWMSYWAC